MGQQPDNISNVGFLRPVILLSLLVSGACIKSQATQCGDLLCPEGRVCTSAGACVNQSFAAVCQGHPDGDACTVTDEGSGTCMGGLCNIGRCGDGIVQGIEACDGTDLNGRTCTYYGSMTPAGLKCNSDCSYDTTGCMGICGDGIRQGSEQCDGTDFGEKTCTDYGYDSGTLACTDTCMVNIGQCKGKCGDGNINPGEVCDGTNFGGATCTTLGHPGAGAAPLLCTTTCAYDPTSCTCGGDPPCATGQSCNIVDSIPTCQ